MRRTLPIALASLVVAAGIALVSQPAATGSAPDPASVVSLVRVHTDTRAERQRVADLGLDLSETGGTDWVGVVLHSPADAARLTKAGFGWTVQIPDLAAREEQRAALDAAYAAAADSTPMPSGRKAYRSLDDYVFDLKELAKRNPGLVKLIKLPYKTTEGRTVWAVEITDDVTAKDGKPVFAIMGTHHAREWTSGEHTIEFAFDLVSSWKAGDPRTHDLLSRARVIAIPIVNPDGYVASFTAGSVFDGREVQDIEGARGDQSITYTGVQAAVVPAYKRKNCRTIDGQDTPPGACMAPGARQLGVDPNRNYGALWGGAGASVFPGDDIYHGPAPFSEPETQNIRALVSHRQVTMLVTNHTFAGLVLRAPGVQEYGVTVDEEPMKELGQRMADANGSVNQAGFELYDTTGTTEDWSYGATGGFGYTFEIPVLEFHPPYEETVQAYYGAGKIAGKGDREAYYIALEAAANTAYHSVITADAPVGALLRLQKSFDTYTSPVRNAETQFTDDPGTAGDALHFRDALDTTMLSTGQVTWHVNPSTRPAVMERRVLATLDDPTREWKHEGQTPAMNEHVDVPFALTAEDAAERLDIALDWPNPDDLDLEVYRRENGKLVQVGSSGGTFTEKEAVSLDHPVPGDYVLRVISYTTTGEEPFTLTAATFQRGVTKVHPALEPFEEWTLSCLTPSGTVLQKTKVQVSRGGSVHVDLAECRAAWPA
jgi:hypothetical protein